MKRLALLILFTAFVLELTSLPARATPQHRVRSAGPQRMTSTTLVGRTLQLNMQGLVGGTNQQHRESAVNYASWIMTTGSPVAVSLNEVCPTQVAELNRRFGGTYHGEYRRSYVGSHPGDAGCSDSQGPAEYGNAIFMRFSVVEVKSHFYTSTDSASTRNIICMKTGVFLITYTACSTHLSAPAPLSQRTELRYAMLSASSSSTAAFGLGDLNTNRANLLAIYLDGFMAADLSYCNDPPIYCKRPTGDMGAAIDYIFGSPNTAVSHNADISQDLIFTDHRSVAGYYTVPY